GWRRRRPAWKLACTNGSPFAAGYTRSGWVAGLHVAHLLEREQVQGLRGSTVDRLEHVAHVITQVHPLEHAADEPCLRPGQDGNAVDLAPVAPGELVHPIPCLL